jgi:transcriptional regulator with XRE-family HTH domain
MNISSNIKRLRRETDLTQEQLADVLGVSFQSVSKWERNDGMPDIMLLPSIARFFNTTVDDLLNMDEEQQKQESKELEEKLWTMAKASSSKNDTFFEELTLLREHAKKYPLDWERQIQLSWYIFSYEYPGEPEETKRVKRNETVEILQRVVDYCEDMNLKAKATDFLVCALSSLGGDSKPKIDKLIDSLPTARYSREMIALQANKKDKKSAINAAGAHIDVLNEVFILMEMYGSAEDKVRINETKTALANLVDLYNYSKSD